jgi:aminoglycoside 2'-N-acetyltransferase I
MAALRELLWTTFGTGEDAFSEDDWQHALGGVHFLLEREGRIVAHASVVERELHVRGQPLRTGYVEAVATHPGLQGGGLGTRVMTGAGEYIRERFELGALATGSPGFYERLGWLTWQGPTFVRTDAGDERTDLEDGAILVLRTPTSPPLDLSAPISCEWRPGDVW